MKPTIKHFLVFILLFFTNAIYSQNTELLRGKFTYLVTSKPNNLTPDFIDKELFSLQISDNRAFFISEQMLKRDSVLYGKVKKATTMQNNTITIDLRNVSLPSLKSRFITIQTADNVQYYKSIDMSLLAYQNPIITD